MNGHFKINRTASLRRLGRRSDVGTFARGLLLWLCLGSAFAWTASGKQPLALTTSGGGLSGAPLRFEVNRGQVDSRYAFVARGRECNVLISPTDAVIALGIHEESPSPTAQIPARFVHFQLEGANPLAIASGIQKLPGQANYYIGNNPAAWRAGIPLYPKVQVSQVYPGIDLVYYGDESARLEYDFILKPGARPDQIRLRIDGVDAMKLDGAGDLVLEIGGEQIRQHAPVIYQRVDGVRRAVRGGYYLAGGSRIGFRIGDYDHRLGLVIDPTLSFSTYIGGRLNDKGWGVAVNGSGDVWVAGETLSRDLATTAGALRPKFQGAHRVFGDGFVAKFSNGTNLSYVTYLGGAGEDAAFAIAVNASGEALVTGYTDSRNFPITNAFQPHLAGTNLNALRTFLLDAFVTKLDTNGALVYSTYLGGEGRDVGLGIAVDNMDRAYVTGLTESRDFPTVNALQGSYGNARNYDGASYHHSGDAFVARFSPDGSTLEYSTYLGGTNRDNGQGIAVDSAFSAYVVGQTASTNFPTANAISGSLNGTNHFLAIDGFISKLSPDGRSLVYSTYLGGFQNDAAMAVAVDSSANAYVTGYTFSTNFPVTQRTFTAWASRTNINSDVFVMRLDQFGSTNGGYSVVFGGRSNDQGLGIAVDGSHNAYVVGGTSSKTNFADLNAFATLPAGFSATNSSIRPHSISDGFIVQLDPSGNSLFSAYFGGSRNDQANAIAFDTTAGAACIVGTTLSTNFPGTGPLTFHGKPPRTDAVFSRIQF
jgi:hypothetical protein